MSVTVEICIHCYDVGITRASVAAAHRGGADYVELCADMAADGLTPAPAHIRAARSAFGERAGVMVMVRPRPGNFLYTDDEVRLMERQIGAAAQAGADGVVLGVLRAVPGEEGLVVDEEGLDGLARHALRRGLRVSFHRAFDACLDPLAALAGLRRCGVDRVLTAGTPWGSGRSATEGVEALCRSVEAADSAVEVLVGGGVTPENAGALLGRLPREARLGLHAYSSVLHDAVVSEGRVRALVEAAGGRGAHAVA